MLTSPVKGPEAANRGVLEKKVFLKGLRPAALLKKDSGTSVFLWMTASEGRKNYYTHRQV